MSTNARIKSLLSGLAAGLLRALVAVLAGGAALRESVTVDEVAHIGAGVSYLQSWICEVGANLRENDLESIDGVLVKDLFPALGNKDQMDVKSEKKT